jgi:hypothetical protein
VLRKALLAAALSASIGSIAAAQTTGTPVFMAPYRAFQRVEFGGSLSDPGDGYAIEGFYRWGQKKYDFGFRGGFQDPGAGEAIFLAGVDFRTRVVDHTNDFPLDGALTAGIGVSFGNGNSRALVPIGVTLGRRVELEGSDVQFTPYFHPVLAPSFGDRSDLLFGLGLGVDITLTKRLEVRVSGALGDFQGIGVSLAILR